MLLEKRMIKEHGELVRRVRQTTPYHGARNPSGQVRIVIKQRRRDLGRSNDGMEDAWQKMSIRMPLV